MSPDRDSDTIEIDDLIEHFAAACPGGVYKLNTATKALFLAILEIHLKECLDISNTYAKRYIDSRSYRDDFQKRYHEHAAGYLRHIMPRIEGGYKRVIINEIVIRNLSELDTGDSDNAAIHNRIVDADSGSIDLKGVSNGRDTSRGEKSHDEIERDRDSSTINDDNSKRKKSGKRSKKVIE